MGSVWAELRRRNVVRVGAAYLIVAWLVLQVASTAFPALHLPDWTVTFVIALLAIGFPIALVLAWAYELTPEGLKRTHEVPPEASVTRLTGRKLDYIIIGVLVLALGYFAYDELFLDSRLDAALVENPQQAIEEPVTAVADVQASIAVLPFANLSTDAEQEYFADGLAEELLNVLAGIPELRVVARTSSFSFKGQNEDIRIIAEKLNVEHILEGSVRKSGDTLRITAQLVEADSGYHLWSESFDRKIDDIFAVQDEIAAAVVSALKIKLLDEVPQAKEIDPEAYALYLQGVHIYNSQRTEEGFNLDRQSEDSLERAVQAFQDVLELEPEYAPAWDWLASVYLSQAGAYRDVHEANALAHEAVKRALALDPDLAAAHVTLGWIRLGYDWDWQGANESMQRALELDPGNVDAVLGAAEIARTLGRPDEALRFSRRAMELDPLEWETHLLYAIDLALVGQLAEAVAVHRRLTELNPDQPYMHSLLGYILLWQNKPQLALLEMQQEPDPFRREFGTIFALNSLGRKAEADQALKAIVEQYEEVLPFNIATAYAWGGDTDQAFRWLERAYERREPRLTTITYDPSLTNLKSDPRWPAFLDKMGLPH